LIKKMGISPRELLRTSESIYRELEIGKKDLSDSEVISLMVEHPDLMQRPIVERGDARGAGTTDRKRESSFVNLVAAACGL
jgi:arsenate reductase-like glutaredoxin family protein